ncbi:MAG: adenylosuccinate synthase [Gemmatales bacterium]|nr:adenylosuccinate synthase [Gemmatales bacterium]MDW7995068.1 adenylosuccinate synthase [Gemmatales bacterium]
MTSPGLSSRVTCVVGLQWGDEAKGKVVDLLSQEHDVVVRFNGGANAGHTVVWNGHTFKFSLLPTGLLHPHVVGVIGNGVVVSPPQLLKEIEALQQVGIEVRGRLLVSDRAHVVFPYHQEEDRLREQGTTQPIGTTGRGIGPCYQDKVGRNYAIRVGELLDEAHLERRLREILPHKSRWLATFSSRAECGSANPSRADTPQMGSSGELSSDKAVRELASTYAAYGRKLQPWIGDTVRFLHQAYQQGKRLLFETAQGCLLDVDHGTYPFVTSSNSSTTGLWSGSGFPARYLERVVGVVKAYTTRVGAGPFPTELDNHLGDYIRRRGKEYGTVTGRPRRCGWFDAVAVRYTAQISAADELAVMLLDVLSGLDELAICVAYEVNGELFAEFPSDPEILLRCRPVYERLPGWKQELGQVQRWADLPKEARHYLDRLSELVGLPIGCVSVGPAREQTIFLT